MTPDFRVLADSNDITAAIRDRLNSLSVTDEAGIASDTVEIVLDDRDPAITLPRTGAELTVAMGYKETVLADMGLFIVDEIGLASPPRTITIKGRAADLRKSLKARKARSWDAVTIGDIVATIADEHGYTPMVADAYANVAIAHLDQTEESDLHLLTRLATDNGAVTKPAGGNLLFVERGKSKSATGTDMPTVPVDSLSRCRVIIAERGKYPAVMAHWYDTAAAQRVPVSVGAGEPVFTIRRTFPDEAAATAAATAKLASLERGAATIRATMPGDNRMAAEGKINISEQRPGVDGEWVLTAVTHTISDSGYVCDVNGETP